MSPTVFREESRLHVHVHHAEGEAKFWFEPQIELAQNHGLTNRQIRVAELLIRRREHDIRLAWREHFGR
jgi:hypothetical protein